LKQAVLAGILALACLVFGGGSRVTAEVIDCTNGSPGPNMTVVIYNNSPDFNRDSPDARHLTGDSSEPSRPGPGDIRAP
jgi:hypothetical protein